MKRLLTVPFSPLGIHCFEMRQKMLFFICIIGSTGKIITQELISVYV